MSAAAGAVGSLAAQFAKLRGHRVIGSAGSDEKVSYLLDELGLDAAFNHRAGPVADLLRAAAPEGIDVYFDCVGGDHLEAALGALRRRGRVALCGAVSQYGRPPRARPTCSRRPPTTSRCAASAAAATCTGWATWCAT